MVITLQIKKMTIQKYLKIKKFVVKIKQIILPLMIKNKVKVILREVDNQK